MGPVRLPGGRAGPGPWGAGAGQALVAAEAAKGRILRWASLGFTDQAASHVFADEQHAEDLRTVQGWVTGGRRRRVVSLFAAESGLAVLDLAGGGKINGRWVAPFNYPELAEDLFDPWVALLADAVSGTARSWETAALATEHVLSRAGALLWRALPDLADRGDELVIVPHRFFRLLPWPAVELPDGSKLGERFGQVVVAPSFGELARRTEPAPDPGSKVVAMADPDGSLPFARLEALDVTSTEPQSDLAMGPSATVAAIKWAFIRSAAGLVHLACHGDFDEGNPWRSSLLASDGAVSLADVFSAATGQGPVVVLGACESGRSFRAPSDEPRSGSLHSCASEAPGRWWRRPGRWTTCPRCSCSQSSTGGAGRSHSPRPIGRRQTGSATSTRRRRTERRGHGYRPNRIHRAP